jgi:hypothetical protein
MGLWQGQTDRVLLGANRPRRTGSGSGLGAGLFVPWWAVWLAVAGGVGWLWFAVIGADLQAGGHIDARHGSGEVAAVQAVAGPRSPGGPALASTPLHRPTQGLDPVASSLVAAARDVLARRVIAVAVPVTDGRQGKGGSFELVEAGLGGHLPLLKAIARHAQRDPHTYGLDARPPAGEDRRRWGTTVALVTFLEQFAARVPGTDPHALEPGDIVVLERRRAAGRIVVGVIGDLVDDSGTPMCVVLDPAEKAARELNPAATYRVLHRLRMRTADVQRIRAGLDLDATPALPAGAVAL